MTTSQAIVGATVLIGPELAPLRDGAVLVERGRIVAAGPRHEVELPEGISTVAASGSTLLPGFIDAHVHIGFAAPETVLAGGVTTVRDLGWPPDQIEPLVAHSRAAGFDGPAILAAGPMLTAPGGYPTRAAWAPPGTGLEIANAEQGQRAVERVAAAGAAIIKIALNPPAGPVLDLETLRAIVSAAHARDLKVTGHVFGLDELDKALDAGVDELAHMLMSPQVIPPETIQRMVSSNMTIVPTLAIFFGPARRTAIRNLHAFFTAGGTVVYGTDLGNEGPQPGIDPGEIAGMQGAGMSGADIIRAATVDAARWLGLEGVGAIAPGYAADLLLVKGDPLSAPETLAIVEGVWRNGVRAR
jgi:imidazolonepropionase-like amidohydrolase